MYCIWGPSGKLHYLFLLYIYLNYIIFVYLNVSKIEEAVTLAR